MKRGAAWALLIVGGVLIGAAMLGTLGVSVYFEIKGIKQISDGQTGKGLTTIFVTGGVAFGVAGLAFIPGSALYGLGAHLLGEDEPEGA